MPPHRREVEEGIEVLNRGYSANYAICRKYHHGNLDILFELKSFELAQKVWMNDLFCIKEDTENS